jgi:3-oxoacyl-(acyl-carrier-protein) synthase
LGIICPVGNTVEAAWANILAGKSGIRPLTHFDVSGFSTRFGGTINDFSVTDYISPKDVKKMDPFMHYGLAAGIQAFQDSGVEVREENADRIGVAIGAGIGGLWGIEQGRLIIERITSDRFANAWTLRQRFQDKPAISFTDLTSMVVMQELGINDVLTEDEHFPQVGMGFRRVP